MSNRTPKAITQDYPDVFYVDRYVSISSIEQLPAAEQPAQPKPVKPRGPRGDLPVAQPYSFPDGKNSWKRVKSLKALWGRRRKEP